MTDLSKRWKKVPRTWLCTLVLIAAVFGFWAAYPDTVEDAEALSFSCSAELLDQLNPKLSMRLLELLPESASAREPPLQTELYPGGQAVGILLRTDGILVVGQSSIISNGQTVNPAKDAGIQAGDVITSVNGKSVAHDDQLALLVDELGRSHQPVILQLTRRSRTLSREITPVYCQDTRTYRIGLLIRDNAGGVGTMTFIDPQTMAYGALGHMISNNETQSKLNI